MTANRKKSPAGTAYSYIRFSTADQLQGESLRRQVERTESWCRRNGVTLDGSTYHDLGVSAFGGEHRHKDNADRFALARFLEAVKRGRVAPDSYLVVENLDRLTREHIRPAARLFMELLDHKVHIVTTDPERVFRHDSQDMTDLIIAVVELSRGHGESARKSDVMGDIWRKKKERAAAGVPMSAQCPDWLEFTDGAFRPVPWKVETVRRLYARAAEGYGALALTRMFNAEGVPVITTPRRSKKTGELTSGSRWNRSYVYRVLTNPAVLGRFQPRKGRGANRKPDGDPIENYYPAVIDEDTFYTVQAAVKGRKNRGGRPTGEPWGRTSRAGLLHDARTQGRLHVRGTWKGADRTLYHLLVPYKAADRNEKYESFPLDIFEAAMLSMLKEVNPRDVVGQGDGADRVLALSGKLADVDRRLGEIEARLVAGSTVRTLERAAAQLEAERDRVAAELEGARREAANPVAEAWGECGTLIDALASADDQDAARVRLRGVIRRIVSEVWCLFTSRGIERTAAVQVWFQAGSHRDYKIHFRPGRVTKAGVRPSVWSATSIVFPASGRAKELDLRNPKHAAALERILTAEPPD